MNLDPSQLPRATDITALHDRLLGIARWPRADATKVEASHAESIWAWVEANHRCNSLLWDEEDLARRTTVADSAIAANKRAIDGYNQARNDATERIDELLLHRLGLADVQTTTSGAPPATAPAGARLHSETAGAMIDRLSILALKRRAMRQQTERDDVDATHIEASRARLARLDLQRNDLAACLDALLADTQAGRAYFKVYRQFKMYNDPQFNPVLVAERTRRGV